MQTFSGTQAAEIVGITYRRLDYWARTDLVRPTGADATGSGSRRVYTYRDLLGLKVRIAQKNATGAGEVTFEYGSLDQLDMLCQRLTGEKF